MVRMTYFHHFSRTIHGVLVKRSLLCMFVNCWHGLLCLLLLLVTLANTLPLSNTLHNGLQAGQRHLFNYNDPGYNDVDITILITIFEYRTISSPLQRTQDIENSESFKTFSSKQGKALKSWSNSSLVLFAKGREIHGITLTNPRNNLYTSIFIL